jgi:hypothetical protein
MSGNGLVGFFDGLAIDRSAGNVRLVGHHHQREAESAETCTGFRCVSYELHRCATRRWNAVGRVVPHNHTVAVEKGDRMCARHDVNRGT